MLNVFGVLPNRAGMTAFGWPLWHLLFCRAGVDYAEQGGEIIFDQFADALNRKVSRGIGREIFLIQRVMALAGRDRCQAISPDLFHGS